MCIDLDATLVTAHSDKEASAGTYKGGFGFHPLLAYLDRGDGTGESLAALLRAGNAGANTATDHIDVFESALAQLPDLPEDMRARHRASCAPYTGRRCPFQPSRSAMTSNSPSDPTSATTTTSGAPE